MIIKQDGEEFVIFETTFAQTPDDGMVEVLQEKERITEQDLNSRLEVLNAEVSRLNEIKEAIQNLK